MMATVIPVTVATVSAFPGRRSLCVVLVVMAVSAAARIRIRLGFMRAVIPMLFGSWARVVLTMMGVIVPLGRASAVTG